MGEPAVKRRWNGTNGVLEEGEPLLDVWRIERCTSHQDVRMAVDIFCDRMDHNICTMIQRVLHVGAQECIIHHNHDPMLMRNCSHGPYIHQAQRRIARRLDPYQLRLIGPYESFDIRDYAR